MRRQPGDGQATCPLCGAAVTMPSAEAAEEEGTAWMLVVTDPGTAYPHIRDEHPAHWRDMCDRQAMMNRTPATYLPRKVNGTLLLKGEDVGDI